MLSGAGLEGELVGRFAQVNPLVAAGEWWRLFTPVLLHASITHILFNMWALWVLGPQIERADHDRTGAHPLDDPLSALLHQGLGRNHPTGNPV